MSLFEQKYPNNIRTVSGLVNVPFQDDFVLKCNTLAGAVAIQMIGIPANFWSTQYKLYIVDNSNNASANNITITMPVGYLINGANSFVINNSGASLLIQVASNTDFIATYSSISSAGHIIQDEGVSLPQRAKLNFTGTGVVATDNAINNASDVTINGGILALPVLNNVYVSKSGSNATGVAGRFDLPFLTIAAAVNAANTAYPLRTQNSRASIIVETGYYIDSIILHDFLDFYLGSSVIEASVGNRCVFDNGAAFSVTTNNVPNCIIYGNATLKNTQAGFAVVEITSVNIKVLLHCSSIFGYLYEAILMRSGYMKVYADTIYMANAVSSVFQCINMATSNVYINAPILEVYNAKIYTNPAGSVNSVIEFFSGNVGGENPLFSKIMLVNCEVGSWSTTRPAINCFFSGGAPVNRAQLTLKSTLIQATTAASISDEFASNPNNILRVFALDGAYVNLAVSIGGAGGVIIGAAVVNVNVVINQGNPL
jgi:hypothetical protein